MNADLYREARAADERNWALVSLRGKVPITKDWTGAPRQTEDDIRRWVAEGHNIGVRTGAVSGIDVIDADAGSDLAALDLPKTWTAISGGGGQHLIYRRNGGPPLGNTAGKLGPKIDTRGDGGQIVLVGSIHPKTGKPYRWAPGLSPDDLPIADLPAHIVERLAPKPKPPKPARPVNVSDAYARAAMERELEAVRTAPKEAGNDQLNRSAFALGQLVGAGLLIEAVTREALFDAATPRRPENEARKTIQSGLEDGMREPREVVRREGRPAEKPPTLEAVEDERPGSPITLPEVVGVFREWLHLPDAGPLYVILGAYAANRMHGDPIWILLIGTPSCGKSELINSLIGLPDIHPAATLTEPALLSGTSRKERAKEAKGGLLLVMGSFGIILCKDLGSILNMNRDARAAVVAAFREIYDGSWTRHVGTDGGRTLHWDGKAGLIGGCTPSIDRHHAVMGAMGERFTFYRISEGTDHAVAAVARRSLDNTGRESEMRRELADAVSRLFAGMDFDASRHPLTDDDKERLIALATFVVKARSAVERDGWNREIELIPGAESPPRLVKVLSQLLAGLDTIGLDRTEAWRVVSKVAFDSIPALRRSILEALNRADDTLDTTEVAQAVAYPRNTTVRGLEDLNAYHVIDRIAGGQGTAHRWRLSAWSKDKLEIVGGFPEMSGGVLEGDSDGDDRALITPNTTHDDFSGEVPPAARIR